MPIFIFEVLAEGIVIAHGRSNLNPRKAESFILGQWGNIASHVPSTNPFLVLSFKGKIGNSTAEVRRR